METGTISQKDHRKHKSPYWRPETPVRILETERVQQVCVWMLEHRLLSFKQWQKLLNGSEPMVKRFLKRMYRAGYLDRFPYATLEDGRNPALYILDTKGIDLLERLGYEDISGIPSKQISSFLTVPHTLAISDFRIALTQAIEMLGWEIETWIAEHDFNKDYDMVQLPGERRKRAVKPDGFIVVKLPDGRVSALFLELDRATENTKTFEKKIACYVEYQKSGAFKKRFNFKGFRVLTVVASDGRRRLENLPKKIAKIPDIQRRYWFTHLDDVLEGNLLIDPIWQIAGDTPNARLFDPENHESD